MPSFLAGQKLTAALLNQIGTYNTFWANPPMFRMYQAVAQSIPNATNTQVKMDTGTGGGAWDTDSGRSGTTPYSYTIPVGMGGRWRFTWAVEWAFNAVGARVAVLYQNGVPVTGDTDDVAANNDFTSEIGTGTVLVTAGDVMSVWGYQNSGGALNTAAAGQFSSFFEGQLVSLASP
jgi:hypothetical protein